MPDTKPTSDPSSVKLTGDQTVAGTKTFVSTTTIIRPDSVDSGLIVQGNFVAAPGRYLVRFRQSDAQAQGMPEDWQDRTVIRADGAVMSNSVMLCSGHTNGVTGDGYDIIPPGQSHSKPFMMGVWADVNGPCYYSQTSSGFGGCHFIGIDNQGFNALTIGDRGQYLLGHAPPADPDGPDGYPVWDVGLDRAQAGRLRVSGSGGFGGELISPKYLVKPASLDDYAIIIYDAGFEHQALINGRGQWIQHHGTVPAFVIVGASGQSTSYLEARPFGSSTPTAYIDSFGEIGTTGPSGGFLIHDRADNTKTFGLFASGNFQINSSASGAILLMTPAGAITTAGGITATGGIIATGAAGFLAVNRRDNGTLGAVIYSQAGALQFFLGAIGSDVFAVGTDGKVTVGAGSTPIKKVLSVTATLDFGSTAAQTSSDLTVSVTGATVGDSVSFGLPAAPPANTSFIAWVSAANVVTVRFSNYSAGAVDPPSGLYRVTVQSF